MSTSITMTPSSVSLKQKKNMWNQHKADVFTRISKDKSLMFNYFFENNDIFGMIHPSDIEATLRKTVQVRDKDIYAMFSIIGSIFFIDQIALRIFAPQFRIYRFRMTMTAMKYIFLPLLGYAIYKEYFLEKQKDFFYDMQDKYSFGFQDYIQGNKIFDRALQVNLLEQLLEKRSHFNWEGVPELQQGQKKLN